MESTNTYAVTGTLHGSIIEAQTEGEARRIFHAHYNGESIMHCKLLDTPDTRQMGAGEREFVKYDSPRKGIFNIHSGIYGKNGWEQRKEERTIIGETETSFVERISKSTFGFWVGSRKIKRRYTIPVGLHKSRLVKWIPSQLELFAK